MDQEDRLLDLINNRTDITFGSLWWIKDIIWETVVSGFKIKDRQKKHPACCIGCEKFTSLFQTIPMLLGSHSICYGFPTGVLSEKNNNKGCHGKEYKDGYFAIRPYNIGVYNVVGSDPGIERNSYKPTMTEREKEQLKRYLHDNGVDIDERA